MHPLMFLPRLLLGAAVAGAALGAAPALAGAASSCNYTADQNLTVTDNSGALPLHIGRANEHITVKDGAGGPAIFCGGAGVAKVDNTKEITIFGPITNSTDGYVVDESVDRLGPGTPIEPTGGSEIEVTAFTTGGVPGRLEVLGTPQRDIYRVGSNGGVDLGGDGDVDFRIGLGASEVRLAGAGGPDILSGLSIGQGVASVPLILDGGSGDDNLRGGTARDTFLGGDDNDTLSTVDNRFDLISGGPGTRDRAVVDRFFDVFTDGVEEVFPLPA